MFASKLEGPSPILSPLPTAEEGPSLPCYLPTSTLLVRNKYIPHPKLKTSIAEVLGISGGFHHRRGSENHSDTAMLRNLNGTRRRKPGGYREACKRIEGRTMDI